MMRNIKFLNTRIGTRNFGLSSLSASLKDKLPPLTWGGKEELTEDEKYFKSFQSRKGISADMLKYMPPKLSLKEMVTPSGFFLGFKYLKQRKLLHQQRYIDERVDILGPDLAAAHFTVSRGGKVRFRGNDTWEVMNEDEDYDLPKKYDPDYLVEEIDISGMGLMYDGLENFDDLNYMKTFIAKECSHFNDWCMDRICSQFSETLEVLDISKSRQITGKGIEIIVKLRNLKHLKVNGLENIENMKLICLLLEECNPQLQIEGITY